MLYNSLDLPYPYRLSSQSKSANSNTLPSKFELIVVQSNELFIFNKDYNTIDIVMIEVLDASNDLFSLIRASDEW
jgi:hypothetical protein